MEGCLSHMLSTFMHDPLVALRASMAGQREARDEVQLQ